MKANIKFENMLSIENFLKNGYTKLKFNDTKIIDRFKKKIRNKINIRLNKINKGIKVKDLHNFHKLKLSDIESNFILDSKYRNIKLNTTEIKEFYKIDYIKAVLEHYYGNKKPLILYSIKHKFISNLSGFRIVMPNSSKVANVHSESTYGHHCFTIWIPIIGFTEKSSLKMYVKSHMYRHEESNFKKNNKTNEAQLIKNSYLKKFKISKRLNFKKGEFILFHPDLLHGGSINKDNKTRVSMELRIYYEKKHSSKQQKRTISL